MRTIIILGTIIAATLGVALACGSDTPSCPADMNCAGMTCGVDPVCGMLCNFCPTGQTCNGATRRCQGGAAVCGDRLTYARALTQVEQRLARGHQRAVLQKDPAWSKVEHRTYRFRFRLLHPPEDLSSFFGDQLRIGLVGHQYQRSLAGARDDLVSPFYQGLAQRFPLG